MAKKDKKEKLPAPAKKIKKEKSLHGVQFPLSAKFSFFIGLMLVAIMIIITMFINNWASTALEKEVKERGIAIAKNIANNAVEPLWKKDDLPLAFFTKEAVQYPMKEDKGEGNYFANLFVALKNDLLGTAAAETIKNEGIFEAVIVRTDGSIASANDVSRVERIYEPHKGTRAIKEGEDVLVQDFLVNGRHYFDIAVPVATTLNNQKYTIGEVHLSISRSVISKVVMVASVKIGLIILVALVLSIIASSLLVNFMVRPIGYLVKGVRAIGEGNYDVEIKLKTSDELGLLTSIFNDTAKSLKEKELLKGAFSTYVSSEVMNEVLKDPKKMALGGKRIKATMLFTDIRGFTSMSETLQPEQVVAVINEYLTVQTDKVLKWKGVLDKFVGDCVMAVYGVPVPKDDDAYRAVRTAMDIRDSIDKLNVIREKTKQICVKIGLGVNTGDVVSGNMGSPQKMDYTVIGDNVNLAARLEANAPGGVIFVSESSYDETKDKINYKELESIKVKGKKDPIRIFTPVSVKNED